MAAKKATSTAKASKAKTATKKTKTATVSTADPVAATTKTRVVAKKVSPKKDKKDFFATKSPLMSSSIAEFIGTFILASVIVLSRGEPIYVSFSLVALVMFLGLLSGAHLNPLVTVGAWATRKIKGARAIAYVIAQLLGAMVALVAMSAFVDAAPAPDPNAAMYGGAATAASLFSVVDLSTLSDKHIYVFFAELLGAAIFGVAFASVLREKTDRVTAGLTVGFGFMLALVVASTAASYVGANVILNPAAALTLNAVDWANIQTQLWPFLVYIVSPILGGVIGFFVYDTLRAESEFVGEEVK